MNSEEQQTLEMTRQLEEKFQLQQQMQQQLQNQFLQQQEQQQTMDLEAFLGGESENQQQQQFLDLNNTNNSPFVNSIYQEDQATNVELFQPQQQQEQQLYYQTSVDSDFLPAVLDVVVNDNKDELKSSTMSGKKRKRNGLNIATTLHNNSFFKIIIASTVSNFRVQDQFSFNEYDVLNDADFIKVLVTNQNELNMNV